MVEVSAKKGKGESTHFVLKQLSEVESAALELHFPNVLKSVFENN